MLIQSLSKKDGWIVEHRDVKNDNKIHIVIIGESMRKDYMSVYGYPHQTTPFLDSASGIFIDGMYAMAPNTVPSLSRTLQLKDSENNLVTLAKKSGFHVYWLSAQGMLGEHDTATSAVALRADKHVFFHNGSYDTKNIDDDELLLPFKNLIDETSHFKKRLFVLHLMGSHPDPCERLHGYPLSFSLGYGKHVDCYLTSIKKTDSFIKRVVDTVSNQNYALVYFSDHGISVNTESVKVNNQIRNNYEIPFIILGSDFKEHTYIKHRLSQRYFLDFMSNWFGVDTNLTQAQYDFNHLHRLPQSQMIEVFDWEKMVDVETLEREKILK